MGGGVEEQDSRGAPSVSSESSTVYTLSPCIHYFQPLDAKSLRVGRYQCFQGVTRLVSQLVSWCFKPSQPQRITSGLNTNFTLSPSQSFHESSYHKVMFFLQPIYIPRALNTGTCIQQGDLFYSAGLHRNHVLATANTEKLGEVLEKNAGEWTGSIEISKKEIPGSKRSMYGYILTYSRL